MLSELYKPLPAFALLAAVPLLKEGVGKITLNKKCPACTGHFQYD